MNKSYLGGTIGILIAFGLLAAGFFFLLPKNSSKSEVPLVTPTKSPLSKSEPLPGQQIIIKITTAGFYPATTTVKPNTRIVWTNETDKKATVNSDDHPTHTKYPILNLGEFGKGQAVQTVLKTKGTYHYHNHLSPSEKGTIVVE